MSQESIPDLAQSAIEKFNEAKKATGPFNDYGSATGFADEFDSIRDEMISTLSRLRLRALRLTARVGYHLKEKTKDQPPNNQP